MCSGNCWENTMNYPLNDALAQVAEETFESLAFMLAMPPEDEAPLEGTVLTVVEFSGPFAGCLVLGAVPELLTPLAGNMLGLVEEAPATAEEEDALRELANVICGNLLPAIAGTEAVFRVHSPVLLPAGERYVAGDGLTLAARVRSCLDEGAAEVELWLDQPALEQLRPTG